MGSLRGWGAGSAFLLAEETQGNTNCQHNGRKVCFLSFLRREKLKSQQRRPPFPLQEGQRMPVGGQLQQEVWGGHQGGGGGATLASDDAHLAQVRGRAGSRVRAHGGGSVGLRAEQG